MPAGARVKSKHGGLERGRGIVLVVILLVFGSVFLGTGISDVQHARQISRSGVPATATVVQDQGWGRFAVLVSYTTAAGQHLQGTLDTPSEADSYPVGSQLRVVYDPVSPSVVTLPGSGSTDGWIHTWVGAFILLLLAAAAVWGWRRARLQKIRQEPPS